MATKTKVKFDYEKWKQAITLAVYNEQARRLVEYAKNKIIEIGDSITAYSSANHMDRTGNLLNSLCWGVSYDGKLIERGFYRDSSAIEESYMHEWFSEDIRSLNPVDGHERARLFSTKYARGGNGWKVFFAVLAPYWGYWEKGFKMKSGGGAVYKGWNQQRTIPRIEQFRRFSVMTQFYDNISGELNPMKVSFKVYVENYNTRKNNNLYNIRKNIEKSPYKEWRHYKRMPLNRRRKRWSRFPFYRNNKRKIR